MRVVVGHHRTLDPGEHAEAAAQPEPGLADIGEVGAAAAVDAVKAECGGITAFRPAPASGTQSDQSSGNARVIG